MARVFITGSADGLGRAAAHALLVSFLRIAHATDAGSFARSQLLGRLRGSVSETPAIYAVPGGLMPGGS